MPIRLDFSQHWAVQYRHYCSKKDITPRIVIAILQKDNHVVAIYCVHPSDKRSISSYVCFCFHSLDPFYRSAV